MKNLPGVPSLPDSFVECNGQVLNDPGSQLNGQQIPNLNGENRFLRGNSTSGGTGGSETNQHTHNISMPIHDAAFAREPGSPRWASSSIDDEYKSTLTTGPPSITENRPPFYNIVWIIRVK